MFYFKNVIYFHYKNRYYWVETNIYSQNLQIFQVLHSKTKTLLRIFQKKLIESCVKREKQKQKIQTTKLKTYNNNAEWPMINQLIIIFTIIKMKEQCWLLSNKLFTRLMEKWIKCTCKNDKNLNCCLWHVCSLSLCISSSYY